MGRCPIDARLWVCDLSCLRKLNCEIIGPNETIRWSTNVDTKILNRSDCTIFIIEIDKKKNIDSIYSINNVEFKFSNTSGYTTLVT